MRQEYRRWLWCVTNMALQGFFVVGDLLPREPFCECGGTQYKEIRTSKNGEYLGMRPICKRCYTDLLGGEHGI